MNQLPQSLLKLAEASAESRPDVARELLYLAAVMVEGAGNENEKRQWSRYRVTETEPKRRMDLRRFVFQKYDGRVKSDTAPYVVTFQTPNGQKAACSCKSGIYRHYCRHMTAARDQVRDLKVGKSKNIWIQNW